jgi:hypothetical protein
MERIAAVLVVAGFIFFGFSFAVMAVIPYLHFADLPQKSAEEVAAGALDAFGDLEKRYPEAFAKAFVGGATLENCAQALRLGRDLYIAEGCWHCHSQFIRPVSNEDQRWGKISYPEEYQNELNLPQLLGTRRVGPDLIREADRRPNDWHAAHFFNPRWVAPTSVMPPFPWFFEGDGDGEMAPPPNRLGLAMITYVQWLGSWIAEEERDVP